MLDRPPARCIVIDEVYDSLSQSLLSHSKRLRLAALRLLDCRIINPQHDQVEVLKRCLQGEEVPLDHQGVRERVLRIGRVGQVAGDEKSADICARWLIAQLKVNLRPLWSPAASALSSLGQRFGDLVWGLLFEEVRKVTTGQLCGTGMGHPQLEKDEEITDQSDDPWEEERSWRDPISHSIGRVVIMWDNFEERRTRPVKVSSIFYVQNIEINISSIRSSKNGSMLSLMNTSYSPP